MHRNNDTKHVIQLLNRRYEQLLNDSRVLRTAGMLSDRGFSNSILIYGDRSSQERYTVDGKNVKVARVIPAFSSLNSANPFRNNSHESSRPIFRDPISRRIVYRYFHAISSRTMIKTALEERPDVIWANDYTTLKEGVIAKSRARSKPLLVYDSHEFASGQIHISSKRYALHRISLAKNEKYLVQNHVDFVVSVNSEIAERISYGKPSYVIHNIPHYAASDYKPNYFHEKYSLPAESRIMLFLGNFRHGSGIELLLRSKKHLDPDVKIVFMGYGELTSYMENYIQQNKLQDECFIHPAVPPDRLMSYVPSADLGLSLIEPTCLSFYYSLPNKFWECITGKIPLIASDLPSMAKLIRKYSLGTTIKAFDPDELCNAVSKLLADYDTYKHNVVLYSEGLINISKEQYNTLLDDIENSKKVHK